MTELIFGEKEGVFIPENGALVYCPHLPELIKVKAEGKADSLLALLEKHKDRRILSDTKASPPNAFKVKEYNLYVSTGASFGILKGTVKNVKDQSCLSMIASMYEESTGITLSHSDAEWLFGTANDGVLLLDDDGICAMLRIAFVGNGTARINTVFTPKEKRGRGYASALVGCVCSELTGKGLTVSVLADKENHAANKMYSRLGFVKKSELYEYIPDSPRLCHSALTYISSSKLSY